MILSTRLPKQLRAGVLSSIFLAHQAKKILRMNSTTTTGSHRHNRVATSGIVEIGSQGHPDRLTRSPTRISIQVLHPSRERHCLRTWTPPRPLTGREDDPQLGYQRQPRAERLRQEDSAQTSQGPEEPTSNGEVTPIAVVNRTQLPQVGGRLQF